MNVMTKKYSFLYLIFLLLSSCSVLITKSKINEPTIKYSKLEADEYFADDKIMFDEEMYYLDKRIDTRNKIIDSLNIIHNNKIIIIDKIGDNNGKRYEINYFFFDDKIIEISYNNFVDNKITSKVSEISKDYFEKNYSKDIVKVYDYFNKESFNDVKGDISFNNFVYFNVTLVLKDKVGYYKIISSEEGYKVTKLN